MKLKSFHVQGFKSLVDVKLDDLQDINVFHGPNNVGKSNILQALEFFFGLLSPSTLRGAMNEEPLQLEGTILNVFNPGAVSFGAEIAEAEPEGYAAQLECKVQPAASQGLEAIGPAIRCLRGAYEGGRSEQRGINQSVRDEALDKLMPVLPTGGRATTLLTLLDARRRSAPGHGMEGGDAIVPQSLRDAFFDTKEHQDARVRARWELFKDLFRQLPPPLGPVELDTAFSRSAGKADLICIINSASVTLDDLGTGLQQLVALIGHLLTTDARMVAIEEPELNLSYPLQKVLLAMFERITTEEAGPSQLFLASHSPAFDGAGHFYRVWMEDRETRVEPAPASRKYAETQTPTRPDLEDVRPPAHALSGYLTTEGLVELPARVREAMGLRHGDYVFFAQDDDGYWKLSGPEEWDALMREDTDE